MSPSGKYYYYIVTLLFYYYHHLCKDSPSLIFCRDIYYDLLLKCYIILNLRFLLPSTCRIFEKTTSRPVWKLHQQGLAFNH